MNITKETHEVLRVIALDKQSGVVTKLKTDYIPFPGEIYQIRPDHESHFAGCLFVVTEAKDGFAEGFVPAPERQMYHFRCEYKDMNWCGICEWQAHSSFVEEV